MTDRGIVFVHAHPDDESLGTGGTMARYASEGAHVCLVTCTNGELGEVADVPELGTIEEVTARLGEIRRDELVEACRHLGEIDVRMLGFHDSGMAGTEGNDDPQAFVKQDLDAPARMIAEILDEVRPQVVVTYNEYGFYGHPDHIRSHEAALRGIELASVDVPKVYYTAMPRSMLDASRNLAEQMGMTPDEFFTEEEIERVATPDDLVSAAIDVTKFVDNKFAALAAHRTQLGTTARILGIPDDWRILALGTEHYVLARSTLPKIERMESDLFEGVS